MKYFARVGSHEYTIEIDKERVLLDGELVNVDLRQGGVPGFYSLLYDHQSHELLITSEHFDYTVTLRGENFQVQVEDERARRLNARRKPPALPEGELTVVAPIPGLVIKALVNEGDTVIEDQPLLILEAMKMENEVRAPRSGKIRKITISAGQRVEQNALLVLMD